MKICVVGTGTMGNGIAQTFAQAGHDVLLKGRSEASLPLIPLHKEYKAYCDYTIPNLPNNASG